jgi:uncharacterized protein
MERQSLNALINIASLLKEPVGSSQSHDINGVIGEEVESFVEGKAKLIHTSRGVLVQCEAKAGVRLVCSRCLGVFSCPVSFTAEEEFLQVSDLPGDSAVSSLEQSEEFTIDEGNVLDLGELIRQYVLLNLPMKPLCSLDCPGMKEENSNAATT